jgi:hypothetical protein
MKKSWKKKTKKFKKWIFGEKIIKIKKGRI